ncbi:MAG: Dyp-type peroxidase [Actinobacteria bacterium]|nr:Dyp-type peroxidase [Actinomycetota bacterium]MCB9412695.1 Dyp-type peroxidase [Actinomycetota bacterium]
MTEPGDNGSASGFSRRRLLLGGAAIGGSAALVGAAAGAAVATSVNQRDQQPGDSGTGALGESTVDPYGPHQAGIATPAQASAAIASFSLRPGSSRTDLVKLMKLLSDDIERLAAGEPALADPVPELAAVPANLTVTVGFGPGVFSLDGLAPYRPEWLVDLPVFAGDEIDPAFTGGDILVQICSDDPLTVGHTLRVVSNDAAAFTTTRWIQQGFHNAPGALPSGTVGRNLFGQVDGIVNPTPGTADFDEVVWSDAPAWLVGGTGMVVRRVEFELETWTQLDRAGREEIIGRNLSDGAPLSGGTPESQVDLDAVDERGLSVIAPTAHARLAAPTNPRERILRRPYNFGTGVAGDAGQIFVAFAADPAEQFVGIQRRLAESDLLNTWVTYTGSAIAAVPPGFSPGGWIGETLLEA